MKTANYDYIVVGLGIAGSCVALQLINAGKKVLVIDQQTPGSASTVAAGIFNPVTGRHMSKTWMADKLFPYLHEFYSKAELTLERSFFNPLSMYRPFVSIEEQNEWMARSAEPTYEDFIQEVVRHPIEGQRIKNPYGGLMIRQSGYVNTVEFCHGVASYLKDREVLLEQSFDEGALIIKDDHIEYRGTKASKIIFCQGEYSLRSKYWGWVPIRLLKGEVLTIETNEIVPYILNRGVYIVPGILKVGATYNAKDVTRSITSEGRKELEEKLNELVDFHVVITGQEWAMRPTTPDRRPIMGVHPEFDRLLIFNGMGTKGVSLAPYFSGVFFDWLEKGVSMNELVDLNRYKSLYWKSA